MSKKVGIVICNYNRCDTLKECVTAILESRFRDMDVYVVDNASRDDSVEMLHTFFENQVTVLVNDEILAAPAGLTEVFRRL